MEHEVKDIFLNVPVLLVKSSAKSIQGFPNVHSVLKFLPHPTYNMWSYVQTHWLQFFPAAP
jgi:hypothetical protein